MSEWTRRTFLMTGVYGAAGLAFEPGKRSPDSVPKPWNARTHRTLRKYRDPAPTVCRMCPAHCGILAFRDGDRVVQIQGAAGAPTNRGGICSRGLAGLERLYDAERQLHPLRRVGPRGSGRWEPIRWEDALEELTHRLHAAGSRKVLHLAQEQLLVQELRSTFGWEHLLVDHPLGGRPGPGSGARWYGAPLASFNTSRARSIFLFGLKPFDGRISVPLAKDLMEAHRSGAAVHTFDCWEGASGSVTRWHPVAPATEAVVAYGIARLILRWRNFDESAFLARSIAVTDGDEDELSRIRTAVSAYTPEKVEELAGVPASEVVYLARRFSEETPSLALAPAWSDAAPAAALLNQLVGAINTTGGVATARGPFFVEALEPTATPEQWLQQLTEGETKTDLYWCVDANPAYSSPHTSAVARALTDPEKVAFLVVMGTHLTETSALADLFLPLATHFESWGLVEGALPDGRSYLFLQQPVTRPAAEADKLRDPASPHLSLFEPWARPIPEARGFTDLLLQLAKDHDHRYARFEDTRSYLGELLRKSWGPGSLEALAARGVWVSEEGRGMQPVAPVSLSSLIPAEPAGPGERILQLVLVEPHTLPEAHPNSRLGREIEHRAMVSLHPDTARGLGLKSGDRVRLTTSVGEAILPLRTLQGLHPSIVAVPDEFGHTGCGSVARAEPTPKKQSQWSHAVDRKTFLSRPFASDWQETEPGEPIWWADEDAGPSLRALFPFRKGMDGLQDWGPLPVRVSKA